MEWKQGGINVQTTNADIRAWNVCCAISRGKSDSLWPLERRIQLSRRISQLQRRYLKNNTIEKGISFHKKKHLMKKKIVYLH